MGVTRAKGWPRRSGRRTMAQTLRCKIHNLIQLSKLLATSWAAATHAVPSACIPRNLDQRVRRFYPRPLSPPFRHPGSFPAASCFGISPGNGPLSSRRFILPACLSQPTNIEFWPLDRCPSTYTVPSGTVRAGFDWTLQWAA